jgi:transcriptional regulator
MYVAPAFKTDDAKALDFAAERAFGTVVAVDNGIPVAAHVPLYLDRSGPRVRLETHVARGNPLHEIITRNPAVLVMVQGPDGYISPDWYVSKDQVPTWLYVSVHMTGHATVIPADKTLAHVERLSDQHEARLLPKPIWRTAKMTAAKRDAMLRAIVGFEIEVRAITGAWKLGQHKTLPDQMEVARQLDARGRKQDVSGGSTALGHWLATRAQPGT